MCWLSNSRFLASKTEWVDIMADTIVPTRSKRHAILEIGSAVFQIGSILSGNRIMGVRERDDKDPKIVVNVIITTTTEDISMAMNTVENTVPIMQIITVGIIVIDSIVLITASCDLSSTS
jgi:hypothetical protein